MSLREFAKIAGVTHTTIARLEANTFETQKIYLDTLYLICKNLHYDFYKFLIETEYLKDSDISTAAPMGDGMTADERELLRLYRELSPYLQGLTIEAVKSWAKKGGDSSQKKA